MRRFFAFILISVGLMAATAARGQSVHWEPTDSGDPSEIQLVFQDCAPDGDPRLPTIPGLTLSLTGRSEQTSIVNFTVTRSTVFSYRARAQSTGPIQIPTFSIQTNKGSIRVPAFTGGSARSAADANVSSRLEPASKTVWAGEIIPLTYTLDVARRSFSQLGTNIEWNAAPLVVEEWSKFEPLETSSNGEPRYNITATTRGYAKTTGPITLNAATQLVNLQSGSIGFGFFQTPRIEQLSVTSNRPALIVRPLPDPAPSGFRGAVGQFKLTSKIVPRQAAVGEPVTWTLELSGTGNWPDIPGLPQREVSKDFSVVQPHAKRVPAEGKLFDVTLTEDVVLVPTKAGDYPLGPVEFVYFDSAAGEYKTLSTPRTTISISPPPAPATPPSQPAPAAVTAPKETANPTPAPRTSVKTPEPPLGIPRDPLPGSSTALTPLNNRTLLVACGLPLLCVPLFWAWLAIRRAQLTDPLRPRREAKKRLTALLAEMRNGKTSSANFAVQLLRWQHDTAILCGISHAAPSAAVFNRPTIFGAGTSGGPDGALATLWLESDRALYSSEGQLPADWPTRAAAALAATRVTGFSPIAALRPRNLLPFVATMAIIVAVSSSTLWAASFSELRAKAESAYGSGDFAAAAKTWSDVLAVDPTDAIARHNLSLALAQQDRWGEAVAHAAAAFVQQPSNSAARWQLGLACEKAGFVPAPLAGFLPAGPLQSLAVLLSPAAWQVALILASIIAAVTLSALLLGAYRRPSRLRSWLAGSAFAAGLALALAAGIALHAYGVCGDERAVIAWRAGILRSIPTEADTTQKTAPLPAGSVAVEDKIFPLGWVRLSFENGQTGWVRQEEVIALWR